MTCWSGKNDESEKKRLTVTLLTCPGFLRHYIQTSAEIICKHVNTSCIFPETLISLSQKKKKKKVVCVLVAEKAGKCQDVLCSTNHSNSRPGEN